MPLSGQRLPIMGQQKASWILHLGLASYIFILDQSFHCTWHCMILCNFTTTLLITCSDCGPPRPAQLSYRPSSLVCRVSSIYANRDGEILEMECQQVMIRQSTVQDQHPPSAMRSLMFQDRTGELSNITSSSRLVVDSARKGQFQNRIPGGFMYVFRPHLVQSSTLLHR